MPHYRKDKHAFLQLVNAPPLILISPLGSGFNPRLRVHSLLSLVTGRLDRWPDQPVTPSAGDI